MTIQPNPDVVFRRLGDRMVLIQLRTNDIFDLNETSARLWELVTQGREVADMTAALAAEYDVDPDRLDAEVASMLTTFSENDLIRGYAPG